MSYRILSLGGGGVRGLMTAVWLARFEEKLGSPIASHFDLIAGTSTGSLIACALAIGIPARDIVRLYLDRAIEIFPVPMANWEVNRFFRFARQFFRPRYDGRGLEKVLRDVFGDRTLGDLPVSVLITSYNLTTRDAFVIKTIKGQTEKHNAIPVWEACKASSSAPIYFPAHLTTIEGQLVPLIDGGVVANNPTACAIAEGVRVNSNLPNGSQTPLDRFVVASFGTGDVARSIGIRDSQTWGALGWVLPIVNVLFDGSADSVDYIARQILNDATYFRFQTKLDQRFEDFDRADPENLNALIQVAEQYLAREGEAQLDQLVRALRRSVESARSV